MVKGRRTAEHVCTKHCQCVLLMVAGCRLPCAFDRQYLMTLGSAASSSASIVLQRCSRGCPSCAWQCQSRRSSGAILLLCTICCTMCYVSSLHAAMHGLTMLFKLSVTCPCCFNIFCCVCCSAVHAAAPAAPGSARVADPVERPCCYARSVVQCAMVTIYRLSYMVGHCL
jgi:hypothetical protein